MAKLIAVSPYWTRSV